MDTGTAERLELECKKLQQCRVYSPEEFEQVNHTELVTMLVLRAEMYSKRKCCARLAVAMSLTLLVLRNFTQETSAGI